MIQLKMVIKMRLKNNSKTMQKMGSIQNPCLFTFVGD